MSMNATLAAAFANIEKWEQEQAEQANTPAPNADDSSAALVVDAESLKSSDVGEYDYMDMDDADVDQSANMWAHISDAAAPLVRKAIQVKGLDEKAVLVQLKRSMFGTTQKDAAATEAYGAGNVNKQLFKGNPDMDAVKAAYYEVYRYVNDNTVPWATGVRILNIDHYFDFTAGLRKRVEDADKAADKLARDWDANIQWDLNRLAQIEHSKGLTPGTLADPDNYPDKLDIRDRFGIDVRYMPVPTAGDFRVAISDEDKASLQKQLEDAEDAATKHVINEMIEPMQRAVEKLSVPIGSDGAIFRDSLIDNIVEVADRMSRINLSDDPAVTDKIAELKSLATTYADNKDVLRSMPDVRQKAASQISALMGQMAGLV